MIRDLPTEEELTQDRGKINQILHEYDAMLTATRAAGILAAMVLAKDAARYRWLRELDVPKILNEKGKDLDKSIDAAMAADGAP